MQNLAQLVQGTPLLLRLVKPNIAAEDNLNIYVLQVDPKHEFLKWTDNETSKSFQVPISDISNIEEPQEAAARNGDSQDATFRVKFKTGVHPSMDCIFASSEDADMWRDGLRHLVDRALGKGPSKSPSAAEPRRKDRQAAVRDGAQRLSPGAAQAAQSLASGEMGQLRERVQLQSELISELQQENKVLAEIAKSKDDIIEQKDAQIAHLVQELKNRGTKADHSSKTESTSRESDDHLRDRETATLKRKNTRLKKLVQKKQQTINNLMQTLQSALSGQASESDVLKTEDGEEEADSDVASGASPAALAAVRALAAPGQPATPSDSGSEPEAIREEVRALTGKRLKPDATPSQTSSSPSPSASRQAAAAAQLRRKEAAMSGFDFSAVGGVPSLGGHAPSMSKNSMAALEAMSREMRILEEKKRVVEALAKGLEPGSDEEDDGFPLQ